MIEDQLVEFLMSQIDSFMYAHRKGFLSDDHCAEMQSFATWFPNEYQSAFDRYFAN